MAAEREPGLRARERPRVDGFGHHLAVGRVTGGHGHVEDVPSGKRLGYRPRRRGPRRRVFVDAAQDEGLQGRVDVGDDGGRAWRLFVGHPADQLVEGPRIDRESPGDELVEEHAEGVDIGAGRGRRPEKLLGSHVGRRPLEHRRPARRVPGEGRHAEVHDSRVAPSVHHHVVGFEVPVQDSPFVDGGETPDDLMREREGCRLGGSTHAPDERRQALAVHVLHGDELLAARVDEVVDAADVGVGHLTREPDLLHEVLEVLGVRGVPLGQELEGHRLVRAGDPRPGTPRPSRRARGPPRSGTVRRRAFQERSAAPSGVRAAANRSPPA